MDSLMLESVIHSLSDTAIAPQVAANEPPFDSGEFQHLLSYNLPSFSPLQSVISGITMAQTTRTEA
eukprot:2349043-Rhodomonas_salina.4